MYIGNEKHIQSKDPSLLVVRPKCTFANIPGCPLLLPRARLRLVGLLLPVGVLQLQDGEEGGALTQIAHRAVGLLQLRHWIDTCQDLRERRKAF